jgi:hypothetical protein
MAAIVALKRSISTVRTLIKLLVFKLRGLFAEAERRGRSRPGGASPGKVGWKHEVFFVACLGKIDLPP